MFQRTFLMIIVSMSVGAYVRSGYCSESWDGEGTFNDPYCYSVTPGHNSSNSKGKIVRRGQTVEYGSADPSDDDGDGYSETMHYYQVKQVDELILTRPNPIAGGLQEVVHSMEGYRLIFEREWTVEKLLPIMDYVSYSLSTAKSHTHPFINAATWYDLDKVEMEKELDPTEYVISRSSVEGYLYNSEWTGIVGDLFTTRSDVVFEFEHVSDPGSGEGDDYSPPTESATAFFLVDHDGEITCDHFTSEDSIVTAPPSTGSIADEATQSSLFVLLQSPWAHYWNEYYPISWYIEEFTDEFLTAILPAI